MKLSTLTIYDRATLLLGLYSKGSVLNRAPMQMFDKLEQNYTEL